MWPLAPLFVVSNLWPWLVLTSGSCHVPLHCTSYTLGRNITKALWKLRVGCERFPKKLHLCNTLTHLKMFFQPVGFPAKIIILYRGFLKWGYPQIIHFSRIFPYKPSILGYRVPPFTEPPIYPGSEQPAGTQALPRRGGKPWWRPSQGLASSRDGKSNEMNKAIHQFHGWYHWYIYIY